MRHREEAPPRVFILHMAQDDPKKCTARKMARYGLVRLIENVRAAPEGCILLDPTSERALSRRDRELATSRGILAVDCSWERAESEFRELKKLGMHPRGLPFLLAANPVNYGAAGKLTTLEALAAAHRILGFPDIAARYLALYKWAPHFAELNAGPLEDYANASDSAGVVAAQARYVGT